MIFRGKTEGFALKKREIGEADQIITFYTEDFGKIDVFAKGIRKIASKLKGGADEINLLQIEFVETARRKTLVDAEVVLSFPKTKKEIERFETAIAIREKTNSLIKGEEKDERIWNLLKETLIETENAANHALLCYYFFFNLLFLLGYDPGHKNCLSCGRKIDPKKAFFCPEKGFLDEKCSRGASPVLPQTMKLIRIFFEKNTKFVSMIKTKNISFSSLEEASDKMLWRFS